VRHSNIPKGRRMGRQRKDYHNTARGDDNAEERGFVRGLDAMMCKGTERDNARSAREGKRSRLFAAA
jgi:hypothetical protein